MKKAKNEAIKENSNATETKNAKAVPSDKIRNKESGDLPFKKVLYGYDPDEVASYIAELNTTYESAARMQESKLSSIKEELVLSNRERDFYSEKHKECQAKLDATEQPPVKDNSEEYKATIAQLEARIRQLEAENAQFINTGYADDATASTNRIAELEAICRQHEESIAELQNKNSALADEAQSYNKLQEEYNAVFAQLEKTKAELDSKEKELLEKNTVLEERATEISILIAESEKNKKQSAELEIKNSVLTQRVTENEEEINRLKEENKTQAFEHAEKINSLETEHAKDKLAMQKELKLYGYYVDRAELTLGELTKQMEQIKQALQETQQN